MENQMTTNLVRSTSLPTATHPLIVSAEEQLQRLKSSQGTSTSSHSTICQRLDGLRKLYDCVDDVLHLPLSQQVLSHEKHVKLLEHVSNDSLKVLDTCSITKDAFSQMKGRVQLLESCLRRKRGGEFSLSNEVNAYMASNKKLNKVICKCFKDLHKKENDQTIIIEDSDLTSLVSLIKGLEDVTLTVLESASSFISYTKMKSKQNSWSWVVSKLLKPKRVSCEGIDISEIEKLNMELLLLLRNEKIDHSQILSALKKLLVFESSIQELEDGLGAIFRLLLKNRVSLLNILHYICAMFSIWGSNLVYTILS
ncbi:PREDICTED: uncharacterized protein LOC109216588 [Nicotiana attenuata]|uniref:DUF241 domain protein n=1 Tax=Nicotiana attenuata TaxID=49451 RepID=A0A1J6K0T2_NICAT|nr:PREDICTED: uncharacterized protein LOC109216588 [Nicotiana attenuata]OIT23626.1 hypothetical protein A4A49_28248 [Nicotiana attenuata]